MDNSTIVHPEDLSAEMLEFTYQNGINFLQATIKSLEVIANRAILLLSYLIIAIGFASTNLGSYIIDNYTKSGNFNWFLVISLGIFILYYICITYKVINFGKPTLSQIGYAQPKNILKKENYIEDEGTTCTREHLLKFTRCIELQYDIETNMSIMMERHKKFEDAIACTLIVPLIGKILCKVVTWVCDSCGVQRIE